MANELKVGDTIKCSDAGEMIDYMYALARDGYETDFMYEKDGIRGYWLIITEAKDEKAKADI